MVSTLQLSVRSKAHLLVKHKVFIVFQRVLCRLALTVQLGCKSVQALLSPLYPIGSIGRIFNVAPQPLRNT